GFRLFGPLGGTDTWLVDNTGAVVHTWPSTFGPGLGVYLRDDGTLLRAINSALVPGSLPGTGGGLQRMAFDGTLLWDYRFASPGLLDHHDITPMPNGNVLLIVWEDKTAAQAIAAGRNPALTTGTVFRPDSIYEVQQTGPTSGTVVWSWHVWDHLIQDFDPTKANFGVVGSHPERVDVNFGSVSDDWNHCNGLDYDPIHDRIVLSAPRQNEVWIIDHSTTTAEAAGSTGGRWGKGGDLLYRWGNPQTYRAGTASDQQLFFEHNPRFIPPSYPGGNNLTVFNNNFTATNSAVFELVLPMDAAGNFVLGSNGRYGPLAPIWNYTAVGFDSPIISSAQRLPNGNTLICSGAQGHLFEVTSGGLAVWQFQMPGTQGVFHAHYYENYLWGSSTALSASNGGSVRLDLLAGTHHAGRIYLAVGTFAGTTPGATINGLHIPLNPDFLFYSSGINPNSPPFINNMGLLASDGSANAAITVPAGYIPPLLVGVRMDFGYVVADPQNLQLLLASNPVPVFITQ
ncbi:MAG TPA: aryl-sulfate sulfotransferase, partial [Planctomycetota bacterium]|nr:aryl-sulfate sulfotransferase [Planctomycetota bacterium]